MTRKSTRSQSAVERLVEQRKQFQDWLVRLDAEAAGAAPSHVAARVRADYAARLEDVTAELGQHEDSIRQSLDESTARAEELAKEREARADELAEARLRRQVGEFDEAQYEEVAGRCKLALGELAKEIGAAERDIERYEEILSLIQGMAAEPPAPPPRVSRAVAPPPVAAPRASGVVAAPVAASAEPPEPEPPKPATKQFDALDELAFLRAVTGGKERPKAAAVPEPPPPPPPPPPPAAEAAPPARPERTTKQRRPSEDVREADREAKSLKCGECGTLNAPTEWYCEKCGAELSAF